MPSQENASTITDNLVSWVDLTPTILDLADAYPKKNNFHGVSFKDVLDEPKSNGAKEIYASHTFHEITMYYPMRVVRDHKYKLIYNIAYKLDYPVCFRSMGLTNLAVGFQKWGRCTLRKKIH